MSRLLLIVLASWLLVACASRDLVVSRAPPPRRPIAYGAVATTDTRCGVAAIREPLPPKNTCSTGVSSANVELVYGPGVHVTIDPAHGAAYFHGDGIYLDGEYRGRVVMRGLNTYGLADTTTIAARWVVSTNRMPTTVRPAPGRAVLHRCGHATEDRGWVGMTPELPVVNDFPRWVFGYPTDRFEGGRTSSVFLRAGVDIPLSAVPGGPSWAIARFAGSEPVRVFGGRDDIDGRGPKGTRVAIADERGTASGYVPDDAVIETKHGHYSSYRPAPDDPRHLRGRHPGGPEPSRVLRCRGVTPAARVQGAHHGFAGSVLFSRNLFDYEPLGPAADGWLPVRMAFPLRSETDDPVFEVDSAEKRVALGLDPTVPHFVPLRHLRLCRYFDRDGDGHWVSRVRLPDGTPVGPWAPAIPCKCQKGWEGAGRCDGHLSEAPLDMPDRAPPLPSQEPR